MPRNGADVYLRPSGTTAVTGTSVSSADYNTQMDDIAADLNAPRPVSAGGTGGTTPAEVRNAIGLTIGTDVMAYDAFIGTLSGLGPVADKGIYVASANVLGTFDLTSRGRTLLAATTRAEQRDSMNLGDVATANILNEDDFATESATRPPSARATKTYVGNEISTAIGDAYKTSGSLSLTFTQVTWTHGESSIPDVYGARLVCKSANNGYSVGNKVNIGAETGANTNATGATSTAVFHSFIDSTVYLPSRPGTPPFLVSASDWDLELWGLWFS